MISKQEYCVYFGVYIGFIIWSIYTLYSEGIALSKRTGYGFGNGWSIIGGVKDEADDEWEFFKHFIKSSILWYPVHILSSEIVRTINRRAVPIAHAITGLAFILATFQNITIFTIFCSVFSFYIISKYESRTLVWVLVVTWVAVTSLIKLNPQIYNSFEQFYAAIFTLSWGFLRCSSYNFSKIANSERTKRESLYNFTNYCGYALYFPNLTFGPLMVFERYIVCIDEDTQIAALKGRIKRTLRDLARILIWAVLKEFLLHFLYINYFKLHVWLTKRHCALFNFIKHTSKFSIQTIALLGEIVNEFAFWTLYSFGYLMGQTFHMFYVITYGLSNAIARFEGMNPPLNPKCLSRMAFSFRMWKNFDQGMYEYMVKYIYFPLCGNNFSTYRKTLATVLTFVFVYAWHGMFTFVLLWTILNFACLYLERIFLFAIKTEAYTQFMDKHFSKSNQLRFYGLIGSQIFIPSAISNFYFFGGVEIGNIYVENTYLTSGLWNYLGLTFCCYCIFQCADLTWKVKKEK